MQVTQEWVDGLMTGIAVGLPIWVFVDQVILRRTVDAWRHIARRNERR